MKVLKGTAQRIGKDDFITPNSCSIRKHCYSAIDRIMPRRTDRKTCPHYKDSNRVNSKDHYGMSKPIKLKIECNCPNSVEFIRSEG